MSPLLQGALGDLSRVPGVRAALIATESDGVAAAAVAVVDVDTEALAAFAMASFRRARLACAAAGFGETRLFSVDAERGRIFVAARPDAALVVLSDADAGAGFIRVAMQRALGALS